MIIQISKSFLKGHPRQGEPTDFRSKILSGDKIHTLRRGFRFKNGDIEDLREWSDKAYRSPMNVIRQGGLLTVQDLIIDNYHDCFLVFGKKHTPFRQIDIEVLAKNDGLSVEDFKSWFPSYFEGQIIHWTDFKY